MSTELLSIELCGAAYNEVTSDGNEEHTCKFNKDGHETHACRCGYKWNNQDSGNGK